MAKQWSYAILNFQNPKTSGEVRETEDQLNARGEHGWELISIEPGGIGLLYFMKKLV